MKKIIQNNGDGSCDITPVSSNYQHKYRRWTQSSGELFDNINAADITADHYARFVQWKDIPQGLDSRITDEANIPADRMFRNAWTDDNPTDTVDVDMSRARDIHMDNIRIERDKKLVLLEVDYIIADEQNDAVLKGEIAAQKQILRDLPTTFDLTVATTPEELKNLWPQELSE